MRRMGSNPSALANRVRSQEQMQTNSHIDKQLQIEKLQRASEMKLLLLGTAECGKSTILKQMRILHDSGFSPSELKSMKATIYNFIIYSMLKMVDALKKFEINFADPNYETLVRSLRKHYEGSPDEHIFSGEISAILKRLWVEPNIQKVFRKGPEYHLSDSASYFLDSLDRISSSSYIPTEQDVLRVRVKTTGVVELFLHLDQGELKVIDVGGQRSERRKWIHCFDDVSAVIFIMALNEYNQQLEEDESTNRMADSLRLFAYICNHDFFIKAGMILFLNKKDLFMETLKATPLRNFFPSYAGPDEYQPAVKYIKEQFLMLNRVEAKVVYTHQTCATDTEQTKFVLKSCFDLIFRDTVDAIGFS